MNNLYMLVGVGWVSIMVGYSFIKIAESTGKTGTHRCNVKREYMNVKRMERRMNESLKGMFK